MVEYPMIEISETSWNSQRYKDFYIIFDDVIGGFQLFKKDYEKDEWYKDLLFVDAGGRLFKVVDLVEVSKSSWFRYMRFFKKFKFVFENTNESLTLASLKSILKDRAVAVENEKLIEHIENSQSFKELLGVR